jgi:hypothetical protein
MGTRHAQMAMLVLLLLALLLLPPSAAPTLVEIQIDAGGLPAHTVDERFVSVTLDEIELGNGFNGTRFESPVLQKCTRALAPAYLRIGGFSEDFTKYRGSTPPPLPPPPFLRGEAPVGPTTFAFNLSAWRKVNRFAASAKLDIVFGLNALTARADTESPWDPSLSGEDQLINYTLRQSYEDFPVAGWELSNELDIKNRPPTPRLVRDSRPTSSCSGSCSTAAHSASTRAAARPPMARHRESSARTPPRSARSVGQRALTHPKQRRTVEFCEVSLPSAEPQDVAHPAAARDS